MKKYLRENHRVEVTLRKPGWRTHATEKEWQDEGHRVVTEIMRHVDDIILTEVVFDVSSVCEHCGTPWDPVPDGTNECCAADEKEWAQRDLDDAL